jgi:hypothetical protein
MVVVKAMREQVQQRETGRGPWVAAEVTPHRLLLALLGLAHQNNVVRGCYSRS